MRKALQSLLLTALCSACTVALADTINIDFSGLPTGAVPGGTDARTPGNAAQFYDPDNAATSGVIQDGIGVGGTRGLVVGNRGNGNDGVIENVLTPRLAQAAGESSVAPAKVFQSIYSFRTASTVAVTNFAFKSETWGQTDRDSYIRFQDNGVGGLQVSAIDIEQITPGNYDFVTHDATLALAYGQWYQVVTQIAYADGPDNDTSNQYVYDSMGNLLISFTGLRSWEAGQEQSAADGFGYNNGQLIAADSIDFQSRGSVPGVAGSVYVDNISLFSGNALPGVAVPEPESVLLVALGGVALFASRRRRTKG